MDIKIVQLKYKAFTQSKKNHILWTALDYMEQYNGRSKWQCIGLAMGFNEM